MPLDSSSTSIHSDKSPFASSQSQKGKYKQTDNNENKLPQSFDNNTHLTSTFKKSKYSARQSPQEKLKDIFQAIDDVNWVLSGFLYYAFRLMVTKGAEVNNMQSLHHRNAANFL